MIESTGQLHGGWMCSRPSYSMAGQDGGSRHGAHLGCPDEQHSTPSRFSQHQTTAGTDSSPEEILRQAECKQQQGEGVEHVEGSSSRLPLEGWVGRGELLEREPAK